MDASPVQPGGGASGPFATTQWTVVLSARDDQSPSAMAALEQLCRTYWRPLYAYVRRRGHAVHDAQDLTQEFFFRLLQKNYLARVDPSKGKFRSFLLVAVNHFLANEWDKVRAIKRGGGVSFLAFNGEASEEQIGLEQTGNDSPERAYDRQWALVLLDRALQRLAQETVAGGRGAQFEELRPFLTGDRPTVSYAALAERLETTEGALKMAVQRLRRRFGELVRDEVAQTVASPAEIESEMKQLYAALGS